MKIITIWPERLFYWRDKNKCCFVCHTEKSNYISEENNIFLAALKLVWYLWKSRKERQQYRIERRELARRYKLLSKLKNGIII